MFGNLTKIRIYSAKSTSFMFLSSKKGKVTIFPIKRQNLMYLHVPKNDVPVSEEAACACIKIVCKYKDNLSIM